MKPLFLLLLLLTMCSQPQPATFMECPCTHTAPEKRLYNQVLTELIEQRFHSSYLPDSAKAETERALNKQFPMDRYDVRDTATIACSYAVRMQLEAVQQNRIFNDSAHFKTIYLDTASHRGMTHFLTLQPNSSVLSGFQSTDSVGLASYHGFYARLNAMVAQVIPADKKVAVAQLNKVQQNIAPADFQLCTAKIAVRNSDTKNFPGLGHIRFSKIIFNSTQTKALLQYDWRCGDTCGRGELLLAEKTAGKWRIKHAEMLWIS